MNVGEALLHGLRDYGVRQVFGIPGDFALPLCKVIEESGILPFHTFSHEPAVGFAADAAARIGVRPAAAVVTYGAGAFNIVNAVAMAYAEKVPVVVISGGPGAAEQGSGLLLHHQVKTLRSQLRIFREVTCDQTVLDDPEETPGRIARVLRACLRESRPVYVEVPRDRVFQSCPAVPVEAAIPQADADAVAACVEEILARLAAARRPVLMIDVEVRRYGLEDEVAELARRLGIPVVTTFLGRGLLADAPVDLRGSYIGSAGPPEVTELVEGSDALFGLGVILSDTNFGLAVSRRRLDLRKAILAHDGQVTLGYHVYPALPLGALVRALNARLGERGGAAAAPAAAFPRDLPADDAPVTPSDIARAINDLFRRRGHMAMAADIGDCLFTTLEIENTPMVGPGYYATMGYAVPAGLGLQAATGERPLVLVGDGAFQMTGWELLNCPRYGWDPIVVVFNNASWEMLRVFQPESRFNDLPQLDFAAIAADLGGDGHRVRTRRELGEALARAAATRGRFQLLDVALARGQVSGALARTVDAFKQMRGA